MKKIVLVVLAIVLGTSSVVANNKEASTEQKLRNEIATLLENPSITLEAEEVKANIEFTINSNNEIVVLTVNSDVDKVQSFVKSRLNYHKIKTGVNKRGRKTFKISLKIKKS